MEAQKDFNELSSEESNHDIKRCVASLNELINYAERHFSDERSFMQQHGCAELNMQQEKHEAFTGKMFASNQGLTGTGGGAFP